ncbi:MAG: hypothetical protein Q4Q17_03580 [Tissierellia bacterium]|nr:hypothetical protein [Tissierellia bacterium]
MDDLQKRFIIVVLCLFGLCLLMYLLIRHELGGIGMQITEILEQAM